MKEIEHHPEWYYPVENMQTLILGTYPPHQRKWNYQFYYPNKLNHFWKVLAELNGKPLTEWENEPAVSERQLLMKKMRVGVQNLGLVIERDGLSSKDEDITILEYQDLLAIFKSQPLLQRIHLTGYSGKTSTYGGFTKYLKLHNIGFSKPVKVTSGVEFIVHWDRPLLCVIGNSTSPTAQRSGIKFEMLVEQFRQSILKY